MKPTAWIFCHVIDNYGDLGVCWRLARNLVAWFGFHVTLWVDNEDVLLRLTGQTFDNSTSTASLQFRQWNPQAELDWPVPHLPQTTWWLIEGFGCRLPSTLLTAASQQANPPIWLNLEYLSAEDWVENVHGLSSPHPRLPIAQRFIYPGFTPATGGLLREPDYRQNRDHFLDESHQQAHFWQRYGITRAQFSYCISVFSYANAALGHLLDYLSQSESPTLLALTDSAAAEGVAAWLKQFDSTLPSYGQTIQHQALTILRLPLLSHQDYDRLLWACDLNLVRGEDSLVRALWAAKPFLWQIYPQSELAHLPKLQALADWFMTQFPADGNATDIALQTWRDLFLSYGAAALDASAPAWQKLATILTATPTWFAQQASHIWPETIPNLAHTIWQLSAVTDPSSAIS